MRQLISVKDAQNIVQNGGGLASVPAGAIITPAARDILRSAKTGSVARTSAPAPAAANVGNLPLPSPELTSISPDSPKEVLEAFLASPAVVELKEQICDMGRRLWARAYVDGNGGNLSIRVAKNVVLCTPTLVSKGFMKPEDMALVDLEGNQLAGKKKRTSEILMHLQIMKAQPKAHAVCHSHPPHATAFAVAQVEPPTCMIPEIEVFVGKVPIAPYRTPGTPEMGKLVSELVDKHNTVLMANHGVVAWSHSIEDAYFKMEITEAYCRTVWVASQLNGGKMGTFSPDHLKDLLNIKQTLGIPDPRIGLKECELCDNPEWRPGVTCAVPPREEGGSGGESASSPEAEDLIRQVTDEIMNRLK